VFKFFPDPRTSCLAEGLIAVSSEVNSSLLLEAYENGIFPWPHVEDEILWFCPPERGVLYFDKLSIPRSLKKVQTRTEYTFTVNQAFEQVIENCAVAKRGDGDGTWIYPKMMEAYKSLFEQGHIMCVECWYEGDLVGGIYGVLTGGVFSGESMFYKKANTSKLSLLYLIEELKKQGLKWIDIQMVTPVLEAFGGEYITRNSYLDLLKSTKAK